MPTNKPPAASTTSFPKKTPPVDAGRPAAELIDARIQDLADWRGEMLARLRRLIAGADASITEEWKWNVPVWSSHGIICTGETYKKAVKLTFPKGAFLPDPSRLFNSSLEGNTRRAIDLSEGDVVNEAALLALIRAAITFNKSSRSSEPKGAA